MARKHGGLGRGLDALIPMREEVEKAMKSAESDSVEILFADDEEDSESSYPTIVPEVKEKEDVSRKTEENVSRETLEEKKEPEIIDQSPKEDKKEEKKKEEKSSDRLKNAVIVRISEVEPNREQPRKKFDDEKLEELSESIKSYGLLKEIPVIVRDYTEKEILELSLVENIQRENLNPIEEARAYKRLMDEFGLSQEEVAQRVSKSRSAVANSLRLLKLEDNVQKMVIEGQITMGHARALLPLEIPVEQLKTAQEIVEKQLSVRETEKKVKEILSSGKKPEVEVTKTQQQEEDPSIAVIYKQIEERLQQTLHTKVSIQRKRNGHGKLLIDFYNSDDLEKIIDKLTDR